MDNVVIRRLKTVDADDISKIYSAITQKSVKTDFKNLIEKHAQRDEDACFVAELDGDVASAFDSGTDLLDSRRKL